MFNSLTFRERNEDMGKSKAIDKTTMLRLGVLARYLADGPSGKVRLEWSVLRHMAKLARTVQSYEEALFDPNTLELSYEGWEENFHNGDPHSVVSEKIELTPIIAEALFSILRTKAEAKAVVDLRASWERQFKLLAEEVVRRILDGHKPSIVVGSVRMFPDQD